MKFHHIGVCCKDIRNEIRNIKKEGLVKDGAYLISDEKEAILFSDRKVYFLLVSYGLIELVENINIY